MTESVSPDPSLAPVAGSNRAAKKTAPMFVDWGRPRQFWESVGGAVVSGVVCGLLLGVAWWAYVIGVIVSFVGGAPSGSQHRTLPGALARGFVAGSIWAACVYATSDAIGATPKVAMPDSMLAFLPWGFIPAVLVAIVSWFIGRRRRAAV